MENKTTDRDFEDISGLIRKEEEDALAFFRTRNFRDKVKGRLTEEAGREMRLPRPLMRAVPVLTGMLVLTMAGISFFLLRRPADSPAPEFRTLASALAQLPGFSHSPEGDWPAPPQKAGIFLLAESVRQALVMGERTKRVEEQSISLPAGKGKAPRLSLDQRIEILFKEKAIERAFLLIKEDSKEV